MINQLRVGFSRISYRALTCPVSRVNMVGRILPVSSSLADRQNYLSHGFNTYSTAFAEASPNNSGKGKSEEAGKEEKAENTGASETELKLKDELTKALNEVASLKKKSSELEVSLY